MVSTRSKRFLKNFFFFLPEFSFTSHRSGLIEKKMGALKGRRNLRCRRKCWRWKEGEERAIFAYFDFTNFNLLYPCSTNTKLSCWWAQVKSHDRRLLLLSCCFTTCFSILHFTKWKYHNNVDVHLPLCRVYASCIQESAYLLGFLFLLSRPLTVYTQYNKINA